MDHMQTQCYVIMARGTTRHETLAVESLGGLPIQNFNHQFYFNGFAVCKAANLFFSAEMFRQQTAKVLYYNVEYREH